MVVIIIFLVYTRRVNVTKINLVRFFLVLDILSSSEVHKLVTVKSVFLARARIQAVSDDLIS